MNRFVIAEIYAKLAELSAARAALESQLATALAAPTPAPATPAAAPAEYLTTAEAAALLGVSAGHLKALRAQGKGPAFTRVGRAVRYARAELARATE